MQSLRRWRWKWTTSSKVRRNSIGDGKPFQAFRIQEETRFFDPVGGRGSAPNTSRKPRGVRQAYRRGGVKQACLYDFFPSFLLLLKVSIPWSLIVMSMDVESCTGVGSVAEVFLLNTTSKVAG